MVPFIATLCSWSCSANSPQCATWAGCKAIAALAADVALARFSSSTPARKSTVPIIQPSAPPHCLRPHCAVSHRRRKRGIKTAILRNTITVFEIVQTVIAFLLAAAACSSSCHASAQASLVSPARTVRSHVCNRLFALRSRPERRNYVVFAVWSAALPARKQPLPLLTGAMVLLSVGALVATALGVRFNRSSLNCMNGLSAGRGGCLGLPAYIFNALAAALPAAPPFTVIAVTSAP